MKESPTKRPLIEIRGIHKKFGPKTVHKGINLDVYEGEPKIHPELLKLSNVVLAPHIASATEKTRRAMVALAIDNLNAALEGKRPPSLINTELWKN